MSLVALNSLHHSTSKMSQIAFEEVLSHEKVCSHVNPTTDFSFVDSFSKEFVQNLMLLVIKDLDTIFKVTKFDKKMMESLETKASLSAESFKDRTSIKDEVTKIVQGLAKIKVGDASFTQKTSSSEENLQEAVDIISCIINEPSKPTESVFIDGHGDADMQIESVSLIADEIIFEGPFRPQNEEDAKTQNKSIHKSTSFLRKMIIEMEDGVLQPEIRKIPKVAIDPVVKKQISIWEEHEEKLIRVIDGPNLDTNIDGNEKEENESLSEEEIGEMIFIGNEPKISTSETEYVEEVVIEELGSFPLFPENEEAKSLPPPPTIPPLPPIPGGYSELESKDNCKLHKSGQPKKWLGNKFRKLFYSLFSKNKH